MDILAPFQSLPEENTTAADEEMGGGNVGAERRLHQLFEWTLALTLGLAALLFLPWGIAPIIMGKEILLILLTAAAAVIWISQAMTTGTLAFPRTYWYIPLFSLAAVATLSTLFSLMPLRSIWQIESPSESLSGILLAVVLAFLYLNSPQPDALFKKILRVFLPAAGLLGITNILGLFGIYLLPFDFAKIVGFTTVGSQNSFALFAVFALVLVLSATKYAGLGAFSRYGLVPLAIILLANLFLINFPLAWFLLALGIAIIIGMRVVTDQTRDIRRIGILVPLLVMTLVFGLIRQRLFAVNSEIPVEVSPSRTATLSIAGKVFKEGIPRILLGSGPATFVYDWEKYRAPEINLTAFWGTRFRQSSSGAFTTLSTLGVIGFGAYLAVLAFAFIAALRKLKVGSPEFTSLFAASAVLGVGWFLYPTNLTLHTLLFASLGLLLGLAIKERKRLSFSGQPRQAVVLSLGLVVFLVGIIAALYRAGERFIAYREAQRGITAFNQAGDIQQALPTLVRATNIAPNEDALQRLLAEALLIRLQNLLQAGPGATSQDLQGVLSAAISVAQTATQQNMLDSNNWATLAGIYESIIPFVEGAERFAVDGYKKWQEVSPQNPFPYVAQARASLAASDKSFLLLNQPNVPQQRRKELNDERNRWLDEAAQALTKSIELKADYADAHFLSAQVFDRRGNLAEAIKKAEDSRQLDSFSVGIAFQLGFLYYKGERPDDAFQEFQRATTLQPNYSNARYFLGLIHDQRGEKQRAIAEFEEVEKFNPQNEEVKRILQNLRAGRSALANIVPPAPAPEERPAPPVEEGQGQKEKALE